MPELPEVETTLRGILPNINAQVVTGTLVRQPSLRWPVSANLASYLQGKRINGCRRRGKYLLVDFGSGHLLFHLGMSGSLRIVNRDRVPGKHDHVDILLANDSVIRFTDPRRFGAVLWLDTEPSAHPLLSGLGPEPLEDEFNGGYLFRQSRGKTRCIKNFIMDSRVVVGVGNIYAAEALFRSGIHPLTVAGKISGRRFEHLALAIKEVLLMAIDRGGTTLRDFVGGDGRPGYFKQELLVYGRENQACVHCGKLLAGVRIANRATVFCGHCQRRR